MVGSQPLVKPCMFTSLFELTPELPTWLFSWASGNIINSPEVLQCKHSCQERRHNPLLDYFLSFIQLKIQLDTIYGINTFKNNNYTATNINGAV